MTCNDALLDVVRYPFRRQRTEMKLGVSQLRFEGRESTSSAAGPLEPLSMTGALAFTFVPSYQ